MRRKLDFSVQRFAHIDDVTLSIGELTVIVGPQATGKSLVAQLLQLAVDGASVRAHLGDHGYDWEKNSERFARLYFGQAVAGGWGPETRVRLNGRPLDITRLARGPKRSADGTMFYIPAQRALTMSSGRPPRFEDFDRETPYVVRTFSEWLREWIDAESYLEKTVFPRTHKIRHEFRRLIDDAIFHGAVLRPVQEDGEPLQLKLRVDEDTELSYVSWTAGQREAVPLLLAYYYLAPSKRAPRRENLRWVVVEEPEMGLHPRAIVATMALLFDLVYRGYRVVISTHSPVILELLWAVRALSQTARGERGLERVFGTKSQHMRKVLRKLFGTRVCVNYLYFADRRVVAKDISDLDPTSTDPDHRGWGGLVEYAARVGDEVARAVAADRRGAR